MRYRKRKKNIFISLTFNSAAALVGIIGLMAVFAKSFGELAIPALQMMTFFLYIPVVTFCIGILGWIFWD